ncbi:hypothetical protein, partial [Mesorhizobium sp.]|uniref:hypothetical protein n=1 Tax=Mesorhizobium sp. TaxID=1871066 RepID=UPI0025BD58A9
MATIAVGDKPPHGKVRNLGRLASYIVEQRTRRSDMNGIDKKAARRSLAPLAALVLTAAAAAF